MELFPETPPVERPSPDRPLAERLRPRRLEDFVGQDHLLGPDKPLGRFVGGKGRLRSVILWGPPGSGKTTLARLLAEHGGYQFIAQSAVLGGVKELRSAIAVAEQNAGRGWRTALFVDELHRFNKAQQDALLPFVEKGTVVFIGATTENPGFEVIPALRSRCRVLTLHALEADAIRGILGRGLAELNRALEPKAESMIIRLANGDARRALTLLDAAAEHAQGDIDPPAVEAAVETRLPDYDKGGEAHYDVISAFIKSLRGSDPNAAIYWLARMLEGGEDPRFITRRLCIFAAEDIGNADPLAQTVAMSAAQAFDRVGLPEGRIILAQATTYLASAPKSNASYLSIDAAIAAVREHGSLPVPMHLRNAPTEFMRSEGYGKGYRYPHDEPDHFIREKYLPEALERARFYKPSEQGEEAEIARRLRKLWGEDKT